MEVLLFGITKDIVGSASLSLHDKKPQTVGELRGLLAESYPELGQLSSLAIAVNSAYAHDGEALSTADEIALIPPVSGG